MDEFDDYEKQEIVFENDIEEIRNVTEETVSEEQNRMEENERNVYDEHLTTFQEEILPQEQPAFTPMTGQMNIEDVLNEWERMKQEIEEKRKEEVKQKVLRQTGKIFENFDESVKIGILADLGEDAVPVRTETFLWDFSILHMLLVKHLKLQFLLHLYIQN